MTTTRLPENVTPSEPGSCQERRDKDVLRFEPGEHTVTVLYWPAGKTRADGRSFGWSSRVG